MRNKKERGLTARHVGMTLVKEYSYCMKSLYYCTVLSILNCSTERNTKNMRDDGGKKEKNETELGQFDYSYCTCTWQAFTASCKGVLAGGFGAIAKDGFIIVGAVSILSLPKPS